MFAAGLLLAAATVFAQLKDGEEIGAKSVIGVRNIPLKDGAEAMLAGDFERGVRLTHMGLDQAQGSREIEAGLSNLCAGYLQLGQFDTALGFCDELLERNDKAWRGYNNRALIFIKTEQWDRAKADLEKGEELNAGAYTMKVARAMYMDAVHPVKTKIEIDERDGGDQADGRDDGDANDPDRQQEPRG